MGRPTAQQLRDPEGKPIVGRSQLDATWMACFGSVEHGVILSTREYLEERELTRSCLKSMLLLKAPVQRRGGILHEAFKHSGSCADIQGYRSLFVANQAGKILQKALRSKVRQRTEALLSLLHCGVGKHVAVTVPALAVTGAAIISKRQAHFFLDTKKRVLPHHQAVRRGKLHFRRRDSATFPGLPPST